MTGSIGATGAGKLAKIWSTDAEFTNLPTVNGGTLRYGFRKLWKFSHLRRATPGTYNNVTVAASGLVTSGSKCCLYYFRGHSHKLFWFTFG